MKSKIVAVTGLALTTILSLSACSIDNGGSAQAAKGTETQGSSAQETTKSILAKVAKDPALTAKLPTEYSGKKLIIGENLQTPPMGFLAEDAVTPIGFDVDITKAIAKVLGTDTKVENMPFDTLITSLQTKRVDLTISGMNDNSTRQQKIDFIDYFNSGFSIMVKKGNPQKITSPDDLCGKTVGAVSGSAQVDWVEKTGAAICEKQGKPAMNLVASNLDQQRFNDLKTGRLDAELNDLPYVSYVAQTSGGGKDFEVIAGDLILPAPYGIGVNKDNPQLRDAVQGALQKLMDDGTYGKILSAWNASAGALKTASVNGGK